MKLDGATTIIVQPSPFTYRERSHIVGTASDNGLGTIFGFPAAARDGALMAYGPDYLHMNQRAPFYVKQILNGTKPADLPVELPALAFSVYPCVFWITLLCVAVLQQAGGFDCRL
jgi:ABC-type uncharacterized transport system substrate-binding protein